MTEGVLKLIEQYQGSGTVTELCTYLNVSNTIFYRWFNDQDDKRFYDAVMRVRARADDAAEAAFFKRVIGFDFVESTERVESGGKDGEKVVSQQVEKHIPPDPGAALNWLKNRRPDDWREKKTVEITGSHVDLLRKFMDEDDA